jgi:hypothetical protein
MYKLIFFFPNTALLFILTLQSTTAQESPSQSIWQQPYTPSRLQWLYINLSNESKNIDCIYKLDNTVKAFYRFESPNSRDKQLVLSVYTLPSSEENSDRNFCTNTAFAFLRFEVFKMGITPPQIELRHYTRKNDPILVKTYQCSIKAAESETFSMPMNKFESVCQ